jgi:hypothetical protein
MITEEEYLKAKQIVQEYEKQLNISDVSCSYIDKLGDDALKQSEIDRKWAEDRNILSRPYHPKNS